MGEELIKIINSCQDEKLKEILYSDTSIEDKITKIENYRNDIEENNEKIKEDMCGNELGSSDEQIHNLINSNQIENIKVIILQLELVKEKEKNNKNKNNNNEDKNEKEEMIGGNKIDESNIQNNNTDNKHKQGFINGAINYAKKTFNIN